VGLARLCIERLVCRDEALAAEVPLGDRLRPHRKALSQLVAFDELTVAEAARALGITPTSARMRLMRARRRIRTFLGEDQR